MKKSNIHFEEWGQQGYSSTPHGVIEAIVPCDESTIPKSQVVET